MDVRPACAAQWDVGETLADRFRAHASDSQHLYGYAMRGMAEDWEAGGPTRMACRGYETAPRGALIQLRLLAGVFRLVLTGQAPELIRFYLCLGGTDPASQAWPVMREVIATHIEDVQAALAVAPQTNGVGRSAALLAGLFDLVAASGVRRIRLLELGVSAGLNLLVDQYAFGADSWHFGPSDSKVQFADAISGAVHPESFEVVARGGLRPESCGCDDRRWTVAAHLVRVAVRPGPPQRLARALAIASSHPVRVDKASASEWLAHALALAKPETLTVVWHSITQMYWSAEEYAAVETLLTSWGRQQRIGEVGLEFHLAGQQVAEPELRTRLWSPDGCSTPRQRLIGTAHQHGVPVTLAGV
jgi:hypothetical protein